LLQGIQAEIEQLKSWITGYVHRLKAAMESYQERKKEEYETRPELFSLYEYLDIYHTLQKEEGRTLSQFARRRKTAVDLKRFVSGVNYMREQKLFTIADLQEKISALKTQNRKYFKSIKSKTEQIEKLNLRLAYAKNYRELNPVYEEWKSKTFFKDKFFQDHKKELEIYQNCVQQIQTITGKNKVDSELWKQEIQTLTKEIEQLNEKSQAIKDEYQFINHIKYAVSVVNEEYGIDISLEIDKAVKRGEKASIIEQLRAFQAQQEKDQLYKEKAKQKATGKEL